MENIIVTGATGNLGQAVVQHLHEQGYHVICTVSPGSSTGVFSGLRVTGYELDLLDEAASRRFVETAAERHGPIRAAALLVGGFAAGDIAATGRAELEKQVQFNFLTAYHLARPLLDHFGQSGGRRQLIFVGSRPAFTPAEGKDMVAYALAKSLVLRLAELINAGSGGNITASVVVPATMDTPGNRSAMPDADFSGWVPPARVADAIGFLLSEAGAMLRDTVIKIYNKA